MRKADESGYPPSLDVLVEGVADAKDPAKQARIYFLRRLPRDPFATDADAARRREAGACAATRARPTTRRAGKDVFDVYSLAEGTGLNGVPYREW